MSTFELRALGDEQNIVREANVKFKTWDNRNMLFAVGSDGMFAISSEDGVFQAREEIIRYKSWDGTNWIAKLWPPASFYLSREGTATGFVDSKLQYMDWESRQWTATPWIPNVNVQLSSFTSLHANMALPNQPQVLNTVVPIEVDSPFDEIKPDPVPTSTQMPTDTAAINSRPPSTVTQPQQPPVQAQPAPTPAVTAPATAAPTPAPAKQPKLEGWLHKRGDVGLVLDWTWKQRYFREADDGKLYYYDDRNQTNPSSSKGKIDLSAITKIESNSSSNLGFNLITPGRTYVLRAISKADLHYWTSNLPSRCPKLAPSPTTSHSQSISSGASATTPQPQSTSSLNTAGSTSSTTISPSQIAMVASGQPNQPGDISALRSNIRNASFSRDKIAVIQAAASTRTFTCQHVFELLKELPFSEDKHEACMALYPKITDPNNFNVVLEAFDFSSDKERVKKALGLV